MEPEAFREHIQKQLKVLSKGGESPADRCAQLQAKHAIGKVLLEILPERSKNGSRCMERLAEAIGHTASWLGKSRLFAKVYSDEDLAELCAADLPLPWSYVQQLLVIPSRSARLKLHRRAVAEGWTLRQLQNEIRNRPGDRRGGGPRIKQPRTCKEALARLDRASSQWTGIATVMVEHLNMQSRQLGPEERKRTLLALKRMEGLIRKAKDHFKV